MEKTRFNRVCNGTEASLDRLTDEASADGEAVETLLVVKGRLTKGPIRALGEVGRGGAQICRSILLLLIQIGI